MSVLEEWIERNPRDRFIEMNQKFLDAEHHQLPHDEHAEEQRDAHLGGDRPGSARHLGQLVPAHANEQQRKHPRHREHDPGHGDEQQVALGRSLRRHFSARFRLVDPIL